jgi:hypothetical protein
MSTLAIGGREAYTVKRVDVVVRHPHLVTQDQFTQVSKKVSEIPEENFTINIELIVYKCRTSSTELEFFKSSTAWARTCNLHIHNLLLYHCATLTLCKMSYVYCIYTVYEPYERRGVGKSSR